MNDVAHFAHVDAKAQIYWVTCSCSYSVGGGADKARTLLLNPSFHPKCTFEKQFLMCPLLDHQPGNKTSFVWKVHLYFYCKLSHDYNLEKNHAHLFGALVLHEGITMIRASLVAQLIKNLPTMWRPGFNQFDHFDHFDQFSQSSHSIYLFYLWHLERLSSWLGQHFRRV